MGRSTRNPLKRLAIVAASTGVTLSLVSGIGGPATVFTARAASYAVQPIAAIAELPSSIGIAEGYDFYAMDEAQIDRTLDAMESLGVKSIRLGVFWAAIEPEEGVYDWDKLDMLVAKATERNMGILGTVLYTPEWASAEPESPGLVGHPDPEKFGDFVGVLADKYAGRISTYEIWNEPTARIFFDPVDPAAYTAILKAAYQSIKTADPSATVVAGSVVAGPTYQDGSAMSPVEFLQGMYDAGAHGYFDAISYHPYLYSLPFSNGATQIDQFDYPIEQLGAMRALMVQNGDGNLKVWITEYGQPTNVSYQNSQLTEQQQAAFIEDLLRTWQNVQGAGPVFIYQTRDTQPDSTVPEDNLGLWTYTWDRKLAADVLKNLIAEFNPPTGPVVNPLQAFIEQIVRAVSQALAFIPNLITQVVQAVVGFVGSILGVNRAGAAVTTDPPPDLDTAAPNSESARMLCRQVDNGDDADVDGDDDAGGDSITTHSAPDTIMQNTEPTPPTQPSEPVVDVDLTPGEGDDGQAIDPTDEVDIRRELTAPDPEKPSITEEPAQVNTGVVTVNSSDQKEDTVDRTPVEDAGDSGTDTAD
ncbi:MAG: beta-galactosidase [Mycolicibacterium neoaurum]|uniref:beta-galactosidase n=1 Tax=Mycolicibacterium neoaurum TaxID=1795 RepID=UPI002FFCF5AC